MEKPKAPGKAAPAPEKKPPLRAGDADTLVDSPATAAVRPVPEASDAAGATVAGDAVQPSDEAAADFLLDKDDATEADAPATRQAADDHAQAKTEVILSDEAESKAPAKPAPAAAEATPGSKPVILGDYRLLKKLGQGGMGTVYKAHQISLDREAAVKVLSKELARKPAFLQRFLREARVMAKLDHPNILRCYEVGEALGYHFLSMEYVEGGTVDTWLKKLGKFSVADAIHVTVAVAGALQHAHDLNHIHRDIKPENILLTRRGTVKVADLGLAKARDDDMSMTKTGTGAGTPVFMAPEQARDVKHVDGRVDIYALGCMLYVLLSGKAPFEGATLVEVIKAKEKGKVTPLRQHNEEVSERLGLIVEKMIAAKPEHRYQSCAEVIVELDALGSAASHLSFFPPEGTTKPVGPLAPKKITMPRVVHATTAPTNVPAEAAAPEESVWYVQLTAPDGKTVMRKLTKDQLYGMVKNQALDAETPVSRARGGPFRALGTYPEFVQLINARITKQKADKKAEKFKALYDKIDKEEKSRQRWRWIHNMYLKAGGLIGLILWLAIVAGVIIGGYFLVRWGLGQLREKLPV